MENRQKNFFFAHFIPIETVISLNFGKKKQ